MDPSGKVQVYPERWNIFGINVIIGIDIAFTGEDLASLQGSGGDYIKTMIGNTLSGLGVPGWFKDLVLAAFDFEVLDTESAGELGNVGLIIAA